MRVKANGWGKRPRAVNEALSIDRLVRPVSSGPALASVRGDPSDDHPSGYRKSENPRNSVEDVSRPCDEEEVS